MNFLINCRIIIMTGTGLFAFFIFLALALIASSFFTGLWVIYSYVFKSPNKTQNDIHNIPKWPQYEENKEVLREKTDRLEAIPYEPVTVTSEDGLKLYGRFYKVRDGAPLDISFHGFRGTAVRDFCGGAEISFKAGHNLLLVDERAHGKSEGKCLTYGVLEKSDCVKWIEYAVGRFGKDVKIVLSGVSMGASVVLLAPSVGIPENVKGIMADSPYTSPKDIMEKIVGEHNLNRKAAYYLIWLSGRIYGKIRLERADVLEAVGKCEIPVLLFHGEADRLIPCDMSRKIKEENSRCVDLNIIKNADHAIGFLLENDAYEKKILEFYEKVC